MLDQTRGHIAKLKQTVIQIDSLTIQNCAIIKLNNCTVLYSQGIYLNNCLFWPVNDEQYGLWFDLTHKKTSLLHMPVYKDTTDLLSCCSFNEFDGKLVAMVRTTFQSECDIFDLKDDRSGWVPKYHVNLSSTRNEESHIIMDDMDVVMPIVHFVRLTQVLSCFSFSRRTLQTLANGSFICFTMTLGFHY